MVLSHSYSQRRETLLKCTFESKISFSGWWLSEYPDLIEPLYYTVHGVAHMPTTLQISHCKLVCRSKSKPSILRQSPHNLNWSDSMTQGLYRLKSILTLTLRVRNCYVFNRKTTSPCSGHWFEPHAAATRQRWGRMVCLLLNVVLYCHWCPPG